MSETGTILDYEHGVGSSDTVGLGLATNKEGTPAEHELGVQYQAPWEIPADGFAEHARRCARALAMTGCPVHLRSGRPIVLDPTDEMEAIQRQYRDLVHASIGRYSAQVHQLVPTEGILQRITMPTAAAIRGGMSAEQMRLVNSFRVLSTVWEREPLPAYDAEALSRVGQAWVACQANARMLIEAGVPAEKVRVVPIPFLPDDPHLALRGRKRRPGPVRFYNIGKWEPRKEQDRVLGAFMMAFRPGEATLIMKTSRSAPNFGGSYPKSPSESVQRWMVDERVKQNGWTADNVNKHIFLIQEVISEERMVALHAMGDVYVSLSRGEGFDMPAYDAKLSGNRMVYTPSGGPQDFAQGSDFPVPKTGTVPCHPFYGWGTGRYLDYDLGDAAKALQLAHGAVRLGPIDEAEEINALRRRFSAEAVGRSMIQNLTEVVGPEGKLWA